LNAAVRRSLTSSLASVANMRATLCRSISAIAQVSITSVAHHPEYLLPDLRQRRPGSLESLPGLGFARPERPRHATGCRE
jgi:hypothetical protein